MLPFAAVLISTATAPAVAPATESGSASFAAGKTRVSPGAEVTLRGHFPLQPATASSAGEVRIQFRPAGKARWRAAERTVSDEQGRYAQRVIVRRSGHFRALSEDGRASIADRVRVKSRLRARVTDRNAKLGQAVAIRGTSKPTLSRRRIVVRIGGERLKTRTDRRGRFEVNWSADATGRYKATVKARGDMIAAGSRARAGATTVYRPAHASYYGPGFYGRQTACGQILTPSTVGVAHKTMPCGTKLVLRYHGRTVKAKVIDRGPYIAGREFDLTEATRNLLGFGSLGTVWSSK